MSGTLNLRCLWPFWGSNWLQAPSISLWLQALPPPGAFALSASPSCGTFLGGWPNAPGRALITSPSCVLCIPGRFRQFLEHYNSLLCLLPSSALDPVLKEGSRYGSHLCHPRTEYRMSRYRAGCQRGCLPCVQGRL